MKNRIVVSLLGVVLLSLATMSTGCGLFDQQGKTADEVNRDHIRMLRINQQQMMRDIDRTLDLGQAQQAHRETVAVSKGIQQRRRLMPCALCREF